MTYVLQASFIPSVPINFIEIFLITVSKCSTTTDGFYNIMDRCLHFATKSLTWFDARDVCRRLGGDLATVNSIMAVKTVSGKIETGGQYWVGLHRISWQNKDNKGIFISIKSINQCP